MILIPEIETVVILVPRTGSGSLRRAIAARYPRSVLLYRHMEADGVPFGYDRWRRVGVVRDPFDRLWSLYNFLQRFDHPASPDYSAVLRQSVARPFNEWIVENRVPFTDAHDSSGMGRYFPEFSVRHALPENRKSQFVYLRPDLGTNVFRFDQMAALYESLGLTMAHERHNVTDAGPLPALTEAAFHHVNRFFRWDLDAAKVSA